MLKPLTALAAVGAALAFAGTASAASPWQHCKSPVGYVHNLVAFKASCTYAGYFAKGFRLGALYHGSPYQATYRGWSCTLSTDEQHRYVACYRYLSTKKQLLRFTEEIR